MNGKAIERANREMVNRGACSACHDFHFTPKDARICQLETQLRAAEEREGKLRRALEHIQREIKISRHNELVIMAPELLAIARAALASAPTQGEGISTETQGKAGE